MVDIYIETTDRTSFASAKKWPGWSGPGKTTELAKNNLYAYRERYEKLLEDSGVQFALPAEISDLVVMEKLEGNTSTNFGAPGTIPEFDLLPMSRGELER
jgi:hypothetical protein